jgi:hypothetical protein
MTMIASQNQVTPATSANMHADSPVPSDGGPYMPSLEEIEEHCREIRREWSEQEHRRRAAVGGERLLIAITPCRISLPDLKSATFLR